MPIKLGIDGVSDKQRQYLSEIRKAPNRIKARLLAEVLSDSKILSGEESLHPEWIDLYKSIQERLSSYLPTSYFKRITESLSEFEQDKEIRKIDPEEARLAFLLGAGASKPKPSDIPTVKELLPDLLTRARRLDRPDLQKLADFCDNTRRSKGVKSAVDSCFYLC